MDIKNFIKETVIQISEAVIEVQKHFDENKVDAIINPREIRKNQNTNYSAEYSTKGTNVYNEEYDRTNVARTVDNIEFDIAVTVEADSKNEIGGRLKVFDMGIGAELNETNKLANVSKVKFKIPLVLPHGKENKPNG